MAIHVFERTGLALLTLLVLSACTQSDAGRITYRGKGLPKQAEAVSSEPPAASSTPDDIIRARIIADILYEARLAYEDNRLTQPSGDNAYDRYREVLDYDPGNAVALEGIRELVRRYILLADNAMAIGQFDSAGEMLTRAAEIDGISGELEAARRRLTEARQAKLDFYALDPEGLRARSLEIMVRLGEIGRVVQNKKATFLITARTDDEGRWIYKVMREAVGGYRLRGNIALGSQPGIQINASP
ncbi:MAG: hypothetical protein RQ899_12390 [Pseudomonadales bacterium]|nr:hypothetical protein [Pseudomonadales bacterium]